MLRLHLVCFFFLLSTGCMSKEYESNSVEYNTNLEPSCYIKLDAAYWSWRDQLGSSKNVNQDLSHLVHSLRLFSDSRRLISFENLKVHLCTREFIFSANITKAMNFYGPNTSPVDLYFFILNKFSDKKMVAEKDLLNVLIDGMSELEKRFEED